MRGSGWGAAVMWNRSIMFPKGWFKEVTGLLHGGCGWLMGGGSNMKRSSITQLDFTHIARAYIENTLTIRQVTHVSMKMVLIHTLVSQRVIVMSSDSFVSIILPMSILLCSITSARIADIVDTCFLLNIWQILDPFCCTDSCWNGWYSRNAESCCQDEELACNEINYMDLPEKLLIGTFGPFQ